MKATLISSTEVSSGRAKATLRPGFSANHRFKITDRVGQAFIQIHIRLPVQLFFGQRDVRLAL